MGHGTTFALGAISPTQLAAINAMDQGEEGFSAAELTQIKAYAAEQGIHGLSKVIDQVTPQGGLRLASDFFDRVAAARSKPIWMDPVQIGWSGCSENLSPERNPQGGPYTVISRANFTGLYYGEDRGWAGQKRIQLEGYVTRSLGENSEPIRPVIHYNGTADQNAMGFDGPEAYTWFQLPSHEEAQGDHVYLTLNYNLKGRLFSPGYPLWTSIVHFSWDSKKNAWCSDYISEQTGQGIQGGIVQREPTPE